MNSNQTTTDGTDNGLGSIRVSRVGRCVLATTNFVYSAAREGEGAFAKTGRSPVSVKSAISVVKSHFRKRFMPSRSIMAWQL
jgi:hypothetical protein